MGWLHLGQPSWVMRQKSHAEEGGAYEEQPGSLMIVGLLCQPGMLASLWLLEREVNFLKLLIGGFLVSYRGI